ncbi:MAG: amino acid ABC transporter permease [Firmicutes bacterium]|nr:amino acid ABC transporter permease [Bacillota bacterium]
MELILKSLPLLLKGTVFTIVITLVAVGLGSVIGLFAGLAKMSKKKWLSFLATCYIDFFRGTPLLVQVFMVYFGIPQILLAMKAYLLAQFNIELTFDHHIEPWTAAILSTSLNCGAYIAEIFRAGVQSIERGQMEAARSLGMTHVQAMRFVILPQAFRRIVPPLGNEFIAMLKDSSLLCVIGFEELARTGQMIISRTYESFIIWGVVALIYLIMTLVISRFIDYLERRLRTGHDDHR